MKGAKEKVDRMRELGHEVVFYTHRNGDKLKRETLQWLHTFRIKYDTIIFGKPHFDVYIGDEARQFTSWDDIDVEAL